MSKLVPVLCLALVLPVTAAAEMQVNCQLNPGMVPEGGTASVILEVTEAGDPVQGASVRIESFVSGSSFSQSGDQVVQGATDSTGIFRDEWQAPERSPHRYMGAAFSYAVEKEGSEAVNDRCVLMVQQVEDRSSAIRIQREKRQKELEEQQAEQE